MVFAHWTIERKVKRQPEVMQKEPLPRGERLLRVSLATKSCAETRSERLYRSVRRSQPLSSQQ